MENNNGVIGFTSKASNADVHAILMGKMGLSYSIISARTGLSHSQIKRRLKQSGSLVGAYRRGETEISNKVIDITEQQTKFLIDKIKIKINKIKLSLNKLD